MRQENRLEHVDNGWPLLSSSQEYLKMSRIRLIPMMLGLVVFVFSTIGLYDHYRTQPYWDQVQVMDGGPSPFQSAILAQRKVGFRIALGVLFASAGLCVWSIWRPSKHLRNKSE